MECPECGSEDLELVEGECGTGVYAPDGAEERRRWEAFRCRDCDAVEQI
jgi:hypothetical protein